MDWINELLWKESVAHTILIYSIVIAAGVALGKLKIFGISLGIAFVLFAGIAMGHFGFKINAGVLDFVKDFGLILFVFSIGLQVGPGFFSSFKKGGITLNLLAMSVVFLGVGIAIAIHFITGLSMPMMVGILSGAVTNTPGLGAAQQAVKQVTAAGAEVPNIGLGYAVAYPFGVLGIILSMLFIRKFTKVNVAAETENYYRKDHPVDALPERISLVVENPAVVGKTISETMKPLKREAVISRILHKDEVKIASAATVLHEGDVVLIVAKKGDIPTLISHIGKPTVYDFSSRMVKVTSKVIVVTNPQSAGKTLEELKLRTRFEVNITRINRAGIEFMATRSLRIQMGDRITLVGSEESIDHAAKLLGNSLKRLYEPNLIPIFIGIIVGILLGAIPFVIHGIPMPVKLGMAGGPLIVAILLSKFGSKLWLTSYTTPSANLMLREIGIVLFLASVGLKAGEKFIPTIASGDGFIWMGYGAIITVVPLLIIGLYTKLRYKRNFFEICGLLAGSMTDPPALAFANSVAQNDAPAVAYATVYPLVMFLRIITAQLLVMIFA